MLRAETFVFGATRGVQEFPELVAGVRVGMARGCGADPRVGADEDADQVGFQDVEEGGQVGVFGGWGVFALLATAFSW